MLINGTQFASSAEEEANLILNFILQLIQERRAQITGEDSTPTSPISVTSENSASSPPLNSAALQQSSSSSSDECSTANSISLPPLSPIKTAVLFLDGEYNQIKDGGAGQYARENNMILFKFAASCSKTQQPNDVMKSFMILHKFFRSQQFKNFDVTTALRPAYLVDLQKILAPVPKASRDTFVRYFLSLPFVFDNAFFKSTIMNGYTKTGVGWPFTVDRILRNCPNIESKYAAEMESIKNHIYEIAATGMQFTAVGQGGTILDETMEEHRAEYFGPVHNNSGNRTTEQVLNQWKATILTDEGTIQRQREAMIIKEAAAVRAQIKREQTAKAKENKQATTRVKCGGKIALLCVREEFKEVLDKRQPTTWWILWHLLSQSETFTRSGSQEYTPHFLIILLILYIINKTTRFIITIFYYLQYI